ncbi:MAG TPA: folylpolyglutamate synthase/dihydrofolate synthase family protein [Stenomitos sp.]
MTLDSTLLDTALRHGIRPGLERTTALLDLLGRPQDRLPVVHVAGTNGKGSVCAFLASILQAAGYRVGRYTSPHLVSYRERFRVNGEVIPEAELASELQRISALAETLDPALGPTTEFELLTAVAFSWFARQPLDLLILEVGLGGRLDATNVVDRPLLTAITRIAKDHTALLGDTLEAIAREKAGILKPGVPLVTGAEGHALREIRTLADSLGSPIRLAQGAAWLAPGPHGDRVRVGHEHYELGLLGAYQAQNASLALGLVEGLRDQGWTIEAEAVKAGLADARWPGRMDRWVAPDDQTYWLDGAHNMDGVEALARALADREAPKGRVLLMGVLADKEPHAMIERLGPLAQTLVLTTPPHARGLDPSALDRAVDHADVRVVPHWEEALATARALAAGRDIVVAGSLYLVGAVYGALGYSVPS